MTSGKVAGNVLQNFSRLLERGKETVATEWGWSPEGRTRYGTLRKRAGRLPDVFVRIIRLCGSANSWWLAVPSKRVYASISLNSIPCSLPPLPLSLSLFLTNIRLTRWIYLSEAFTFDERRDRGYLRTDGCRRVAGNKNTRLHFLFRRSYSYHSYPYIRPRPYVVFRVFIVPLFFLHALQKIIGTARM